MNFLSIKNKLNDKCNISKKGITMVEIIMVVMLTTTIAMISLPLYSNMQVSAQLNDGSNQMIQILRTARQKSVSGVQDAQHGVRFNSNNYIFFQGGSYDTRQIAFDRVFQLENSLSIVTTLTNDEVVFSKGLGVPSNSGTITISHSVKGDRQISINSIGIIEEL
jgi:Tfp pilus assembly protein FimT